MAASAAPARWIVNSSADKWIFFGIPALICLLGMALLAYPAWVVPAFWCWLLCIDGPHLLATGLRCGFDRTCASIEPAWRKRGWWALLVPLVAWALWLIWPQLGSMDLLQGIGLIYSWHHLTRQHEGILAIYHAQTRVGTSCPRAAPESLWMRRWLWCVFLEAAVATPANRSAWFQEASLIDISTLTTVLDVASWLLGLATLVCITVYMWIGLQRLLAGASLRPWWFGLLPVGMLSSLALLAVGWMEPLYAGAHTHEDRMLAVTLLIGILHGTQYIAIVFASNQRRHAQSRASWVAKLAARPIVTMILGISLGLSVYFVLNAARSTLPGPQWFELDSPAAQFAMAVYWAVFLHHYHVDSKIWRIAGNADLQCELNIA